MKVKSTLPAGGRRLPEWGYRTSWLVFSLVIETPWVICGEGVRLGLPSGTVVL